MPVLFISAILVLPQDIQDPQFSHAVEAPLPILLHTSRSEWIDVDVRKSEDDSLHQVEIRIHKPLEKPETLVYLSEGQGSATKRILLGKLSSLGLYRFTIGYPVMKDESQLELFDPFRQTIYSTIPL